MAERQALPLAGRQVDLEVEEEPADGAVGPAGEDLGLEGELAALGVEERRGARVGERALGEGDAGGDRPALALDARGLGDRELHGAGSGADGQDEE